jgi:hypothetical protein
MNLNRPYTNFHKNVLKLTEELILIYVKDNTFDNQSYRIET